MLKTSEMLQGNFVCITKSSYGIKLRRVHDIGI